MSFSTVLKSAVLGSAIALSSFSFAADIDMSVDANDIAIKGYDTVSYFTQSTPVKGSHEFTATHKNAIYYFSSAENRDTFRANPAKYAPQYGGYCAMGVALEKKFETDPNAWRIVDGKLYLNLNKDIQKKWLTDVPGHISTSEQNWPEIKFTDAAKLNAL